MGFTLHQVSETRGDCTAHYRVELDRPYTVREFVAEVAGDPQVFGSVFLRDDPHWFMCTRICEFDHGDTLMEMVGDFQDDAVVEVEADGGYTCYAFYLETARTF